MEERRHYIIRFQSIKKGSTRREKVSLPWEVIQRYMKVMYGMVIMARPCMKWYSHGKAAYTMKGKN